MYIKEIKLWLVENNLDNNELFSESLKCYSVGANKAAYLYSYLAFLDYIKNVVLSYGTAPKSYEEKFKENPENKWKEKIKNLDSDDKWEEETLNFIKEGTDTNVFRLKDDIRTEFLSKRDIRNTCAHNKTRTITTATFEDLWDFIKYSKPYFVINGSVQLLKENLEKILNYLTHDDYNNKIKEIYSTYYKSQSEDKKEYFDWLLKLLKDSLSEFDDTKTSRLNILMEYIFENKENEEYRWIKNKDIFFDIYLYFSIEKYYKLCNKKEDLIEYSYKHINVISDILHSSSNYCKINEFMNLIYLESEFSDWWNLLDKLTSHKEDYNMSENIKKILLHSENIDKIFYDLSNLYTYNGWSGRQETSTLDFMEYNKYLNKIKIVLTLEKENITEYEKIIGLKERCKKILKDDNNKDNFSTMFTYFEKYQELLKWIKE